jgi:hypothetical protein
METFNKYFVVPLCLFLNFIHESPHDDGFRVGGYIGFFFLLHLFVLIFYFPILHVFMKNGSSTIITSLILGTLGLLIGFYLTKNKKYKVPADRQAKWIVLGAMIFFEPFLFFALFVTALRLHIW